VSAAQAFPDEVTMDHDLLDRLAIRAVITADVLRRRSFTPRESSRRDRARD
jgi:hypothetical protein